MLVNFNYITPSSYPTTGDLVVQILTMENSENTSMEEDGQLVLYSGSSGLDPSPSSNNSNSNETMSNDSPDFETEMDGDNAGEEDDDNEEDGNDDEVEEEEERVEYSGSVE